jgi:acetyl esterase
VTENMTGEPAPGTTEGATTEPAELGRLSPGARPMLEAIAAGFPDVGGEVSDAAEARRILAQAPTEALPAREVREVADRSIPGPQGAPALPVRIYRPHRHEKGEPRPTVVYLHGGGWVLGSLDSHDSIARGVCAEGEAVVVSVDYRLAPEARFPAAVEDTYAAVCWAAENIGELGGDPGALVVAGDSAGGNLATVGTLIAKERGGPDIALQVLLYPGTDPGAATASRQVLAEGYFLTERVMRWFGEQYFGEESELAHAYAAPLRADLAGLPPAHVVTAGCDPLCDEGRAHAWKLREAGVAVSEGHFPGMFHGFFHFPEVLPEAAAALAGVGRAVAATAKGTPA